MTLGPEAAAEGSLVPGSVPQVLRFNRKNGDTQFHTIQLLLISSSLFPLTTMYSLFPP